MTANAHLVSAVVPCYRQGRYLAGAVESLLAQTHPAVEVIVVDDGSDDDTAAVARGFGDRVVCVSKPNGGLASARNAGLARATGGHVLFLDADDLLHPEAVAKLVAAVAGDPAATAVMGFRMFRDDGTGGATVPPPAGRSFFPWVLARNYQLNGFLVPAAVARAAGGFGPRAEGHEDHEFLLRVALRSDRLASVPFAGAYYRQHAASMSRNPPKMIRGRRQLWARMVEELEARRDIADRHGAVLLRQLYIGRLAMAAQAPDQSRTDLDGLIRRLHRIGVRSQLKAIDYAYALVPPNWRDPLDHVLLKAVKRVKPRVYRGLTGEAGLGA